MQHGRNKRSCHLFANVTDVVATDGPATVSPGGLAGSEGRCRSTSPPNHPDVSDSYWAAAGSPAWPSTPACCWRFRMTSGGTHATPRSSSARPRAASSARLRAGVTTEDLAAWATGARPSQAGRKFRALMDHADRLGPVARVPVPTLPGWIALGTVAHPTQLRAALTSVLPHGLSDQAPRLAIIDRLLDRWPEKPLWISAVRVGDGRLTWFGRTDGSAPHRSSDAHRHRWPSRIGSTRRRRQPHRAAIPVLARPVRIGRHRYVDGGVHSPTNADGLAGEDLDLVIVLSPMGHTSGDVPRSPSRRSAHRRLQREVRTLRDRGTEVQVISPDAATVRTMGWNMLDRGNTASVMRAAFLGTLQQLRPDVITTLGGRVALEAV